MKHYKLPLVLSILTTLIVSCTHPNRTIDYMSKQDRDKTLKAQLEYKSLLNSYSFGNEELPSRLISYFSVRKAMDYNETFEGFLESVDGADGKNDNRLTREGLIGFLSGGAFGRVGKETNPKLKE